MKPVHGNQNNCPGPGRQIRRPSEGTLTGDPYFPGNALQVIRYLQQSGFIDVLKVLKEG